MVKQFRPPMDAYTVELPAGLIDKGETPAQVSPLSCTLAQALSPTRAAYLGVKCIPTRFRLAGILVVAGPAGDCTIAPPASTMMSARMQYVQ